MRKILKNAVTVTATIEKNRKENLEKLSEEEDRSMSHLIRKGIERLLIEKGKIDENNSEV